MLLFGAICLILVFITRRSYAIEPISWYIGPPGKPLEAGGLSTMGVTFSPDTARLTNGTWEIIDTTSNSTMDIVSYEETFTNLVEWCIPINFPSGNTYALRITSKEGVFTSPHIVVVGHDFSPCPNPPYYPTTLNNATRVRFIAPALNDRGIPTPWWDYVYGPWIHLRYPNSPATVEIVAIDRYAYPSSTGVLGSGTGTETLSTPDSILPKPIGLGLAQISLDLTYNGPAVIRVRYPKIASQSKFSFISEVFTIGDGERCPFASHDTNTPVASPKANNSIGVSKSNGHHAMNLFGYVNMFFHLLISISFFVVIE
ncbi:hypothetical protein HK098_003834 [Nowakowskiella sp. JEL0407]|nr:hypothetical protein HK098_003834 [Nowakowskiella sp. JEL0407]